MLDCANIVNGEEFIAQDEDVGDEFVRQTVDGREPGVRLIIRHRRELTHDQKIHRLNFGGIRVRCVLCG